MTEAPGPIDLLTGKVLPKHSYPTDRIRKVEGDPEKAARKAAKQAAAASVSTSRRRPRAEQSGAARIYVTHIRNASYRCDTGVTCRFLYTYCIDIVS
jgi:hypothetical protein